MSANLPCADTLSCAEARRATASETLWRDKLGLGGPALRILVADAALLGAVGLALALL